VRRALDRDQLVLFYQPIHETRSRRVIAAEALLRARRSSGEIRNAEPIAVGAEELPDLFRLDSWVVHTAREDAAAWQRDAPEVRLNLNLSPREFEEGKLATRLTGSWPMLALEITETRSVRSLDEMAAVLRDIRKRGIELWLDDFGTGHSSLQYLQRLPVDGLKLPAELVRPIAHDARSRAIVRATIALAHDLGLRVIAEGVEHDDQLALLGEWDCNAIQGFLFSRPMPVEELVGTLSKAEC
jgi:EAL domain-containing protein (putative c-di-GMP-specific phosphodiesterase class I)